MPIVSSDVKFRLSGGAANTDPLLSLGGAKSNTDVTASTFWDTVSSGEATSGDVEYRCGYVHNNHPTLTMENAVLYLSANTPSADTALAIGLGTSAVNGVEQTVAGEGNAPSGVTFTAAPDAGSGVSLGNIPPGQHRAFWSRRTVDAGAVASNDTAELAVAFDTAA